MARFRAFHWWDNTPVWIDIDQVVMFGAAPQGLAKGPGGQTFRTWIGFRGSNSTGDIQVMEELTEVMAILAVTEEETKHE